MWGSFHLWLGDGVHEVLENEKRAKAKRKAARKAKCRKMVGLKPNLPKEPLEEEKEVLGKIVLVEIRRTGLSGRKIEWEGVQYRWSGTRMFASGRMKGVKGWTHDLKLIRKSDNALIATFEKGRWASYSKSIRSESPPNKKKQLIVKLQIRSSSFATSNMAPLPSGAGHSALAKSLPESTTPSPEHKKIDDEQGLNPQHSLQPLQEHPGFYTEAGVPPQ